MVSGALTLSGDAVRNVYQKLFVKLRIPGYDVTPDDFEDATSRADLIGFIDAVIGAPADTYRTYPSGTLERALAVDALVAARAPTRAACRAT